MAKHPTCFHWASNFQCFLLRYSLIESSSSQVGFCKYILIFSDIFLIYSVYIPQLRVPASGGMVYVNLCDGKTDDSISCRSLFILQRMKSIFAQRFATAAPTSLSDEFSFFLAIHDFAPSLKCHFFPFWPQLNLAHSLYSWKRMIVQHRLLKSFCTRKSVLKRNCCLNFVKTLEVELNSE